MWKPTPAERADGVPLGMALLGPRSSLPPRVSPEPTASSPRAEENTRTHTKPLMLGRPAEPEAQAAPCPRPTAPPAAASPRLGLPLGRRLREAAPAGQATRTEGPGRPGSGVPSPQELRDPGCRWNRKPGAPEKPGGGEERSGRSPCPGDGSDPLRAGDAEDPGIPRAAQRPLRRAKGFRPAGLGPAGRNCTHSPHAATDGASRPRPLLPGPDPGPPAAAGTGTGRPGEGARGTPELGRGAQGSDVRAPGPLSSRRPDREAPGLGIADGPGRKESPGVPGSASVLLLKWFLISAGRTALCSPATLLLMRCASVLNGRCRPGHQGVTRN
ncbi:hypothetical protein R6Z07M_019404 [Ovis aries]